MKTITLYKLLAIATLLGGLSTRSFAVTPPVVRSTEYNGAYSNIIHYAVQP